MDAVFSRNLFFVNEHKGSASNYDIVDPKSNSTLLACREEALGMMKRAMRSSPLKRMTSFAIAAKTSAGDRAFKVQRGPAFFRSEVAVLDDEDKPVGAFRERWSLMGCVFDVLDAAGNARYELRGHSSGWDYRFSRESDELARVKRKPPQSYSGWFSSVDNYTLEISSRVPKDDPVRVLILGSVLCIDMVLNE